MTPRVRTILESRWEEAGGPVEGWVWPAPTRSGHLESSSLKKQHARAFREAATESKKNNLKPVRQFVLYSLRHTFLTRLGESGCDAWTLARSRDTVLWQCLPVTSIPPKTLFLLLSND